MSYPRILLPFLLTLAFVTQRPVAAQSQNKVADQLGLTREQGSLPVWVRPDDQSLSQLGQTVRDLQKGVLIVGNPECGHGTAFVISRQHRLLATNAHVADILHKAGSLTAVLNGETTTFIVQRVWYHPGVVRYLGDSQSMVARSQDPQDGPVCPIGPDVAVLQLADEGPVLDFEFDLATPDELSNLFAQPVGMIGFPGHDSHFPQPGESPSATYHQGVVSRVTDFQGRSSGDRDT